MVNIIPNSFSILISVNAYFNIAVFWEFFLLIIYIHIPEYGYGLNTGHFNSYIVFHQVSIICLAIHLSQWD